MNPETKKDKLTCTTETSDIAGPVRDGGFDNLEFGLAEYAEGEAPRTFKTYKGFQTQQSSSVR